MRPLLGYGLVLGLAMLGPRDVAAQRILGTVLRADGATPAPGVLVVAFDSTAQEMARAVTRGSGDFSLSVDHDAPVSLRLLRPGHLPQDLGTRRLATDEVVDLVTTLEDRPIPLPAWRTGARSCRGSAEDRAPVLLLLEEARKTLLIAQARIGDPDLSSRAVTYDHRTARNGEDTLRSLLRRVEGPLPETFRESSVEELERDGFFVNLRGERIFRAPTPPVLIDPWFVRRHCFTLALERGVVPVLHFRPTREARGLVEVSGSYRFHPQTLALTRVDFRYEGLSGSERSPLVAGMIDLTVLRSGDHVITAWEQRFPLIGYRSSEGTTTFVRSSIMVADLTGFRSQGGFITAVGRDGRVLWQRDPVTDAMPASRAAARCSERALARSTVAAEGTLPADDSASTPGRVLLRAVWTEPVILDRTTYGAREQVRETLTDESGGWVLCDLPPNRAFTLQWEVLGNLRTLPVTPVREPGGRVPERLR